MFNKLIEIALVLTILTAISFTAFTVVSSGKTASKNISKVISK